MTNSRVKTKITTKVTQSDVNRTSTSTLANDATLFIPVAANKTYFYELHLFFNAHATPDFKYTMTGPSGSTGIMIGAAWHPATGSAVSTFTTEHISSGVAAKLALSCSGSIIVSSTAGNLQLQWAQNTSDANDCKLLAGSTLILYESS